VRIVVAAVGRLRDGPELQLIEDYGSRIRSGGRAIGVSAFDILEVEAPKGLAGAARQAKEAALVAEASANATRRIALDERGKDLSSEALARIVGQWRDEGAREIAFLIGGADGHDEATRRRSDLVLSFGRATWPHMLARAMLAEQIYRVMTILSGHPYHRA
jgi:23S rRNA (pseudouridine1915-N3)-methyltransferase